MVHLTLNLSRRLFEQKNYCISSPFIHRCFFLSFLLLFHREASVLLCNDSLDRFELSFLLLLSIHYVSLVSFFPFENSLSSLDAIGELPEL